MDSRIKKLARCLTATAVLTFSFSVNAETEQAPEKPCVAIATPKAQLGQGATGQDVGKPVQDMFISYLSGPMLEVVTLQSKIPAQMKAEAKQAGCEFFLTSEVKYKKKKKFGKALSIGAGVLSSALPYAGVGGGMGSYVAATTAANVANTTANAQMQEEAMQSLNAAQGTIHKGDSITLDYKLVKVGEKKPTSSNSYKAKAQQDGEDLILPMIEQAATEVFTTLVQ